MTCEFKPEDYDGTPMGMFHCPECGEMVLAGIPHPDYDLLNDPNFGPGGEDDVA